MAPPVPTVAATALTSAAETVPAPAAAAADGIAAVSGTPVLWLCALGVFAVIFPYRGPPEVCGPTPQTAPDLDVLPGRFPPLPGLSQTHVH